MELSDLQFVFDLMQEEEIKKFETMRMEFSYSRVIISNKKEVAEKRFVFITEHEFDIHVLLTVEEDLDVFYIAIKLKSYKNNSWSNGIDEVFLPDYLEDIEPIIVFLQRKKIELEQSIQKTLLESLQDEKELRLQILLNPGEKIKIFNSATEIYQKVKSFKEAKNFEQLRKDKREFLIDIGVL